MSLPRGEESKERERREGKFSLFGVRKGGGEKGKKPEAANKSKIHRSVGKKDGGSRREERSIFINISE